MLGIAEIMMIALAIIIPVIFVALIVKIIMKLKGY